MSPESWPDLELEQNVPFLCFSFCFRSKKRSRRPLSWVTRITYLSDRHCSASQHRSSSTNPQAREASCLWTSQSSIAPLLPGCHYSWVPSPALPFTWNGLPPPSSLTDSSHTRSVGAFLFPREAVNSMTSWPFWNCTHRRVSRIASDFPLGPLAGVVTQQNYLVGGGGFLKPMDPHKFSRSNSAECALFNL